MARVNKTQYAILGCLSIKPMTAYDIKQFMARSTSYFWTEREGQLYSTLATLTQEALVKFTEEPAEKNGVKKIFHITSEGLKVFQTWLHKPIEQQIYRNELLLKLFFGNNQSNSENAHLLKSTIRNLQRKLDLLKNIKSEQLSHAPEKRKIYIESVLDYGICLTRAELTWCEKTIPLFDAPISVSTDN